MASKPSPSSRRVGASWPKRPLMSSFCCPGVRRSSMVRVISLRPPPPLRQSRRCPIRSMRSVSVASGVPPCLMEQMAPPPIGPSAPPLCGQRNHPSPALIRPFGQKKRTGLLLRPVLTFVSNDSLRFPRKSAYFFSAGAAPCSAAGAAAGAAAGTAGSAAGESESVLRYASRSASSATSFTPAYDMRLPGM